MAHEAGVVRQSNMLLWRVCVLRRFHHSVVCVHAVLLVRAWVATGLGARRNRLYISLGGAVHLNTGLVGCCACHFAARRWGS